MVLTTWLIIIGLILLIPTGYAGYIGAPYAPTRIAPIKKAFELLGVGKNDVVVDLGVGDGKILLEASKTGARATGYELSPILYAVAWLRFLGQPNIKLKYGNFFNQTFPDATIIFTFLMPKHMNEVRELLIRHTGPKLRYVLVYAFPFKGVTPHHIVREPKSAPLYIYEAESLGIKTA